ncbi:hypothetical protein GGF31_007560 [Allomyces arbusculus]|nr:hypothetical protein GGF31_007560 [Allomyces arbusculus]
MPDSAPSNGAAGQKRYCINSEPNEDQGNSLAAFMIMVTVRLIPGAIEPHPTECALVVHYLIVSPPDDPIPSTKTISLKSLGPTANLPGLAQEIIAKCKLIHPAKQSLVEQALSTLQSRHAMRAASGRAPSSRPVPSSSSTRPTASTSGRNSALGSEGSLWGMDGNAGPDDDEEFASLEMLDQYVDLLYEDAPAKLRATGLILALAMQHSNLPLLAEKEYLFSALSRTLREETIKSLELSANIIAIFHQFAMYPPYHPLLTANKVGDMCMKLLDQEIKRLDVLTANGCGTADVASPPASARKAASSAKPGSNSKVAAVLAKQDALLYGVVSILLHQATDPGIQVKMVKRGIVPALARLADRPTQNVHVMLIMAQFLIVLAQYRENIEALRAVAERVAALIPLIGSRNAELQEATLKLFLNLSHDGEWRNELIRMGVVSALVDKLHDEIVTPELLLLLYQISCDERSKAMFTYTDALPTLLHLVLTYPKDHLPPELMALAINLAVNEHNAELWAENGGLTALFKRLMKTRDYLLLKMLRNMSMHPELHLLFLDHLDDLLALFTTTSAADTHVELLGILANLRVPDLDYAALAHAYPTLLPSLARFLAAQNGDDLVLEAVQFVCAAASDTGIDDPFVQHRIPGLVLAVMRSHEDDDEMVLQSLLACTAMVQHLPACRAVLLDELVPALLDVVYDRHPAIRAAADAGLDAVADLAAADGAEGEGGVDAWANRIRRDKFHFHNAEWIALATMAHEGHGGGEEEEEHEQHEEEGEMGGEDVHDHHDGSTHHVADTFGHVKLVYA